MDKKTVFIIKLIIVSALAYFIWKETGPWTAAGVWLAMAWCESIRTAMNKNSTVMQNLIARYLELENVVVQMLNMLNKSNKTPDENITKH